MAARNAQLSRMIDKLAASAQKAVSGAPTNQASPASPEEGLRLVEAFRQIGDGDVRESLVEVAEAVAHDCGRNGDDPSVH